MEDNLIVLYIFKGLISQRQYARKYLKYVKTELFNDQINSLFVLLWKKYIKEFKNFPEYESFLGFITSCNNNKFKEEQKTLLLELMEEIRVLQFSTEYNYTWLDEVTKKFLSMRRMEVNICELANLFDYEVSNFNDKIITDFSSKILSSRLSDDKFVELQDVHGFMDDFYKETKSSKSVLKTGFNFTDRVMNGGWMPKTVSVIVSEANAGKTLALMDMSHHLYLNGYSGMFISYEIDKMVITNRYLACATDIPTHQVIAPEHELDVRNAMKQIKKKTNAIFNMEYQPDGSSTAIIENLIMEWQEKYKRSMDFLVVDYLTCLCSPNDYKGINSYEKYGNVISDLKQIADKFNISVLTASQLNRGGYKSKDLDASNLGDSLKIAQKADNTFYLIKEAEIDETRRLIKMVLDKSRVSGYNRQFAYFVMHKPTQRISEVDITKQQPIEIERLITGENSGGKDI